MKIFIVIALSLIQKSSSACSEQGVHQNPDDGSCQTYLFCLRLSDGMFIEKLYSCPNGTLFDSFMNICDKKAKCVIPPTTLSTTTIAPKNDFECKAEGTFPDEDDPTCTRYFFCYHLHTGKYIMRNYTCPSGTTFNPRLQTCSKTYTCNIPTRTVTSISTTTDPKGFNCIKQGRFAVKEDETCRSYYECLYLPGRGFTQRIYFCPSVLKFDPNMQNCNSNYHCAKSFPTSTTPSNSFVCPSEGRFPDSTDLTYEKYFYCVHLPTGELGFQIYKCPEGEEFDRQLKTCSSAYRSSPTFTALSTTITTKTFTCTKQGRFPLEDETCRSYYYCLVTGDGSFSQQIFVCPNKLKFDPRTQSCNSNYHCSESSLTSTTPGNSFVCPSEGRFPDSTDSTCKEYFYCVHLPNGELGFQIYKCPEGEEFDPRLKTCSSTYSCNMSSSTFTPLSTTIAMFSCVKQGRFPLEDGTCRSYYYCLVTGDGSFSQQIFVCPNKLKFDPRTQSCNSNYHCPESSLTSTTPGNSFVCPSEGRFPDSTDSTCKEYFYCVHLPNGELGFQIYKCPGGEEFDPRLKTCSSTYSCNMSSSTFTPLSTTIATFSCVKQGRFPLEDGTCRSYYYCLVTGGGSFSQQIYVCPNKLKFDPRTQSCNSNYQCIQPAQTSTTPSYDFICPSAGKFPNDRDITCKTYFDCDYLPNGEVEVKIFKCQDGENFDPTLKDCTENYKCSIESTTTSYTQNKETTTFSILTMPPVEKTTETDTLSTVFDQNTSTTYLITTDVTKVISEVTEDLSTSSIFTSMTTDAENIICKSVGKFPDSTDETCESYFTCALNTNGQLESSKGRCEFNELFDPNLEECSSTYTCHGDSGCTSTGIPREFSSTIEEESDSTSQNIFETTSTYDTVNIDESSASSVISSLVWDVSKTTPKYTSRNQSTKINKDSCESAGRFPIEEDNTCTSYYLCAVDPNGNMISYRYNCVVGKTFDPSLRQCSLTYICDRKSTPKGHL